MAEELSLPVLARAWQMLLRGIDEIRIAPDARGRRRDAAPAHRLRRRPALAGRARPAVARRGRSRRPCRRAVPPAPAPPASRSRRGSCAAQPVAAAARGRSAPSSRSQPRRRPSEPADFAAFVARLRDGGEAPLAAWLHAERPPDPLRAGPARAALRRRACPPTSPAASARRRCRVLTAGAGW